MKPMTSAEIRQAFLDFFTEMGHTVVPSSPLPLRDNPTLLFTNAGMNQFVNTFLGKEERPYKRAATAQKCMRVQGKHNDLENVGPSPRHHTFFEMLGNFSFGDYFKAGAIRYAYDFMTQVCQIPPQKLWFTVHQADDDAYNVWVNEIGVPAGRVLRMGDKSNFWMMGDVGPCGPTSEIHYDWGPEACTCRRPDCSVLLDNNCGRWLEVWNLVFMQYNQAEDGTRTPLPKPGVDTGMGLERITSVVQQTPVTYHTDLFAAVMDRLQAMLDDDAAARQEHETGYRVIADHGRAATFLIGDGVVPGNTGGGYVLRMIIRRAARFGRKIGFTRPFLAEVAQSFIDQMGEVYPELRTRQEFILRTVTLEEERFARTLDSSMGQLEAGLDEPTKFIKNFVGAEQPVHDIGLAASQTGEQIIARIDESLKEVGNFVAQQQHNVNEIGRRLLEQQEEVLRDFRQRLSEQQQEAMSGFREDIQTSLNEALSKIRRIPGEIAFDLYSTHGLPMEITRDVAGERGFTVDEEGYRRAREEHAQASGGGKFGEYEVEGNIYLRLLAELVESGRLEATGVKYDPYSSWRMDSTVVALVQNGRRVTSVAAGEGNGVLEIVTAATPFYVEAGGEVSDTGRIVVGEEEITSLIVEDVKMPVPGLVVHIGRVVSGEVAEGDAAVLEVDNERRWDIRRNHTATHLLHRELRAHLGKHVAQAGSLVAPDRLRFDFTHSQRVDAATLAAIEAAINRAILDNRPVRARQMPQKEAISQGAMALFGEKYGDVVRAIQIGEPAMDDQRRMTDGGRPTSNLYSFELCGGLHVNETGEIGLFRFISEGAVSAGVRRVEAVTGRAAQALVAERLDTLDRLAHQLNATVGEVETRLGNVLAENRAMQKEVEQLQRRLARSHFESLLANVQTVAGVKVLAATVDASGGVDTLREMADWFRDRVASGVAVLAAVREPTGPVLVVAVTDDLVEQGVKAGDIARQIATMLGGSGGGRPALAQAGGKDASKLPEALAAVPRLVEQALTGEGNYEL